LGMSMDRRVGRLARQLLAEELEPFLGADRHQRGTASRRMGAWRRSLFENVHGRAGPTGVRGRARPSGSGRRAGRRPL